MTKFLNDCMEEWRKLDGNDAADFQELFTNAISSASAFLGDRPFRPERALNAAVFDSVMVGLATRLAKGPIRSSTEVARAYRQLLADERYASAYRRATADEESVKTRMDCAVEAFADIN